MLGADGNYVKQREMSIAFEVDGPYKVPSSPFNPNPNPKPHPNPNPNPNSRP